MKDFREYIEEKEYIEKELNESVVAAALAILAIPTAVALATWGSSVVITAYGKTLAKIINGVSKTWKKFFAGIRGMITRERVEKNIKEMATNEKVKKQVKEQENDKQKFRDVLSEIYEVINKKDWKEASTLFKKLDDTIQNNPDVIKVIISEISKVLKEPPLYIQSPGNKTYQAIKKVINIKVARAAAAASKLAIEENLNNDKEIE